MKKEAVKIVFIVGPTASGKSAFAMKLARVIDGEIICADSQTLRKGLDIGTAKPSANDRKNVAHHMLDVIEPYERYSVAQFKADAELCIQSCIDRKKVPIIVGGSGLYIDALFFNYTFTEQNDDVKEYESMSVEHLHEKILSQGLTLPKNAQNPRHLVGVLRRGNESEADRGAPRNSALIFGMSVDSRILQQNIKNRIEDMIDHGLIEEVEKLIQVYGEPPSKLDAICYPLFARYLKKEISLSEAKELFSRADWQYARRQIAWFKRNSYIQWIEPTDYNLEKVAQSLRIN